MKVFGTAGIRMRYGDELDPLLALRIGNAVGRLGISKEAYIVHDTRTTSHVVSYAVSSGLMSAGVNVIYVGTAPTPVAAYSASKYRSLGISVTASHNPPEYNGMKFYDNNGYEFTRDLEAEIEKMLDEHPRYVEWSRVGQASVSHHVLDEYVEDLLNFVEKPRTAKPVNIVLDCANGASYYVAPLLVRALGAKPITLNCNPDGYFPIRPPEPRKDVLEGLLDKYSVFKPHAIFAFDGDADRLAVLDPLSGFIRQDRLLAFYAKKVLESRKGHVVVSIDTGYVVDDVVLEMGGTVERYNLGKTHERVKELGRQNVVMAGEPWKLILTEWGPWVDGVLQVALLTKYLVETGKNISKLLDDERIPDYPWDRRSYLLDPPEIRELVYRDLVDEMSCLLGDPVRVIDIDGYRFEYKDRSWVLVRKSGTEPKLRIYAEAGTSERLVTMVEKVERKIHEITNRRGGRILEVTIG
ncbi:MAG: phosphopentomutase/phosphoglucosamine mutase [Desulfurococcaceae archaeon]